MSERQNAARWCFTINNPTDADKFWCVDGDDDHPNDVMANVDYLILQEERGEQGTLHWQGFIILKKRQRLQWLKRRINARAHWEVARGTNNQARDYCRKDDTYTGGLRLELGKMPEKAEVKKPNERLQEAAEELDLIKEGYKRPAEIPSMTLMQCGFLPAYKELTADILGPYRPTLEIITLVGPPGTGKSYSIQKFAPGHGRCIVGNNGVWFQQPLSDVMVFEEFCGQIQLQRMLQYLDPYPLALEIKGGMRPAMYTKVIITSNTPPHGWYSPAQQQPAGAISAYLQKRDDAINALFDRIGYAYAGFRPGRTCGHYYEAPVGADLDTCRAFFQRCMSNHFAEPVTDEEEDDQD